MDDFGIPRIEGADVLDLARRQGHAVARERTWQIALDGWRVTGTTAARLGEAAVGWDRFARDARLAELARRSYAALEGEDRDFQDAFTDGVNEGLRTARATEFDTLGCDAGPVWEPWMPSGVFALNQILFASFPTKLWRRRAAEVVGEHVVALFHGEPVGTAGSNAWLVGAGRTATGLPVIAGDPHRLFEAPNCYQQVHLVCPEFDVTGFTFPGVPGVQHFAHAGEVAWGITNAMADYQDLVVRGPDAGDRPVVAGEFELRIPSWELADLGLRALLPLLRARSVEDVLAAFEHWVEPVNHLVVADRTGRAVRRVVGRVPRREERARWYPVGTLAWDGWVTLPSAEIGAAEIAVTANQRLDGFEEFGVEFAPPYRADRITSLLAERADLSAADMAPVALDHERPPTVLAALVDRTAGPVDDEAFAKIADEVVAALAALPVLAPLADLVGGFYAPWFHLPTRIAQSLDRLLSSGDELGFDPLALVADAVESARERGGDVRRLVAGHALGERGPDVPAPELTGDLDAVCSFTRVPGTGHVVRGPVARYVWDLADRSAGGWVVPLGASGDLTAPHGTDQVPLWLTGGLAGLPSYPSVDPMEDA